MLRHRDVAASPARAAGECWDTIANIIASTLDRSSTIDSVEVATTLVTLTPAGRALVAGGHLEREPVTLVAEPLRLTIGTISAYRALAAIEDENTNPVPGAATATDWTVYLPTPPGLGPLIEEVTAGVPHAAIGTPPTESTKSTTAVHSIDLSRLDPHVRKTP